MSARRTIAMTTTSLLLAAGATLAAGQSANAVGYIHGTYPDKESCMKAGTEQLGKQELLFGTNPWGCGINPGPDGGWILWEDVNMGFNED